MDTIRSGSPQMFRLWIATYADWRPSRWNESPPLATALEPVEDALYSADEAAMFLEGFNSSMLEYDQPIWAVAVPITVRYEGDAQAGRSVRGFAFPPDPLAPASMEPGGEPPTASSISTPIAALDTVDAIENRT